MPCLGERRGEWSFFGLLRLLTDCFFSESRRFWRVCAGCWCSDLRVGWWWRKWGLRVSDRLSELSAIARKRGKACTSRSRARADPHVGNPSFFSFSLAFAPTIMSPTLAIESKDGVTAYGARPVRRPVLNGSNDSSDLDERELAKVGKKSVLRACSSRLQKTWQYLLTCRETLRF